MENVKKFLKKVKWDSILISVLTIAIGVLCVVMPNDFASIACWVCGISLILAGVSLFVRFCLAGLLGMPLLVPAVLTVLLGVFCLTYPELLQDVLIVMLGLFIVVEAMESFADSIYCAKAKVPGWIWLSILSLATACLGVAVMFCTFDTIVIFAGISMILEGVERLILTLVYSKKVKDAKKTVLDLYHTVTDAADDSIRIEDADDEK